MLRPLRRPGEAAHALRQVRFAYLSVVLPPRRPYSCRPGSANSAALPDQRGPVHDAVTDARLNTAAWRATREFVKARDGYLCQIKGPHCTRYATCVDHVVARADGGDMWALANLRASCRRCNSTSAADRTNARRRMAADANYVTRL